MSEAPDPLAEAIVQAEEALKEPYRATVRQHRANRAALRSLLAAARLAQRAAAEREAVVQAHMELRATAEERARTLEEAAREVWNSVPATFEQTDPMVRRHAAALNALGALLSPTPEAAGGEHV